MLYLCVLQCISDLIGWVQGSVGLTVIAHVPGTEIVRLIHVNPNAIKRDLVVEAADLLLPPPLCLLSKEVWVMHST